jgi:hypothetical protein
MARPLGSRSAGRIAAALCAGLFALAAVPTPAAAQDDRPWLRDRGPGIAMSQFGTYITKGQFLIYPFFEYYYDSDLEYEPGEFGFGTGSAAIQEYRGEYRASEGILFLGFGLSDRLALEMEAAVISAEFTKAATDTTTALPSPHKESGLGDVEGQIRYRFNYETASRPEYFTYFETVFPTGEENSLIGTSVWELKLGFGIIKGLSWGTVTARAGVDWESGEKRFGIGEYAVEYLRRLSPHFRVFFMLEGAEDELAAVPEIQWHIRRNVFVKANVGFGVTSKATDFAPEVGVMIALP